MTKAIITNPKNLNKPKPKKPNGKIASRKSEKQKALEAQFKKEQKRALALIARREKAGYVVDSKLKERASKRPKRITAASIARVSAISPSVVSKKSKMTLSVNGKIKTLRGDLAQKEIRKQKANARAAKNLQIKLGEIIVGKTPKPVRVARWKNPNGRSKKVLTRLKTKPPKQKPTGSLKQWLEDISRINYDKDWHENQENYERYAANAIAFFDDHLAQLHAIGAVTPIPFGRFANLLEEMIDKFGHEKVAVWYAQSEPPQKIDREYYKDYMPRADMYFQAFLTSGFIWGNDKNQFDEFYKDLKPMLEQYAEENNASGYSEAAEDFELTNDPDFLEDTKKIIKKETEKANRIKFEPKDETEEGWL